MKNLMINIKANRAAIIRRTLIVACTVAAIALVGYAYTRSDEILKIDGLDGLDNLSFDPIVLAEA